MARIIEYVKAALKPTEREDLDAGQESCEVRAARFTGQLVCVKCSPDCEHYICVGESA